MSYEATFEFDEVPIGAVLVTGRAEINFDRSGSWSIHRIDIEAATDECDAYLPIDGRLKTDTQIVLFRTCFRDIDELVRDEIASLPSARAERAYASYEHWRRA